MKYWMDTEFITAPYSIDLISVGLVAEDGRELAPTQVLIAPRDAA